MVQYENGCLVNTVKNLSSNCITSDEVKNGSGFVKSAFIY